MSTLNRACAIGYEVSLILVVVLALLAPMHAGQTRHLWVVQTLDPFRALIEGDLQGVTIGDLVPLYRLGTAKYPIGEARIDSIDGNLAHVHVQPEKMAKPLGRHARLSQVGVRCTLKSGKARMFLLACLSRSLATDRVSAESARPIGGTG